MPNKPTYEELEQRVKELEHKRAEDALRESENKYKALLENLPQKIFLKDENSSYISCNGNYSKDLGIEQDEIVGKNDYDFFTKELAEKYRRDDKRILKGGKVEEIEENYVLDGEKRIVQTIKVPLKDEKGKSTAVLGILWDITYRKKALDMTRQQNEFLNNTIEALTHPFYVIDVNNYHLIMTNSAAREGFMLAGNTCYAQTHGKDEPCNNDKHKCPLEEVKRLKKPVKVEHIHYDKDGNPRNVEVNAYPVFDNDGNVIQMIEYTIDITERIQARKAMEKQTHDLEERLKELGCLYAVSKLIAESNLSLEGTFRKIVSLISQSWQYPEICCARIIFNKQAFETDIFHETIWKQSANISVSGEEVGVVEVYYMEEKQEIYEGPFLKEERELIDALARELAKHVKHMRGEKEKEKLSKQLRQAQKMETIGVLAGGIAHDFNNIITPIIIKTELMLEDIDEESPFCTDLEDVISGVNRAKELVDQILTFSRQGDQELKPLQIHLIVKEVLHLLRPMLPTTIEINSDVSRDCGAVLADPTQIHRLVMNLCTNSYHAMQESGGILKVSLKPVDIDEQSGKFNLNLEPGEYVQLSISDTGCGMDNEVRDKIFDPFFTTKEVGKGTGLGLSVVHGIVTSSGGEIVVQSEPGQGTTFHIYLPRVKSGVVGEAAKEKEVPHKGTENILVVDDEEGVSYMLKQLLERNGYQVDVKISSPEALEEFRSYPERYDLVITDYTMPKMTGLQLSQEMLKIKPGIPIILMSGFNEVVTSENFMEFGVREYMAKPFSSKNFTNAIRRVLDKIEENIYK